MVVDLSAMDHENSNKSKKDIELTEISLYDLLTDIFF